MIKINNYILSIGSDMMASWQMWTAWWQETFWHAQALTEILWLTASVAIGFGLIRIFFDDFMRESLSRFQTWLSQDEPDRSSMLLSRLIELRLLIVTQFLVWVGTRLFVSADLSASWLILAQNLMIATVVVSTFRGFFRSRGVARLFSGQVWLIGIINGLGLFDRLLFWLEKDLFTYAETEISLLVLFKFVVILFVGFWIVNLVIGAITGSIRHSLDVSSSLRLLISKIARFGLYILIVIVAIESLGIQLQSLSFFAGAIGLGLGLGLQRLVANLASGMVLLADKSIKPGDFVEIDGRKGIIKEMTSRAVRITDLKNIDYIVPNERLMGETIINWSHNSNDVWMFVVVGVAYDTDLDQAMSLMQDAARNEPLVSKKHKVGCYIREFADSSIELLVSFVVEEPRKGYFGILSNIRYAIWRLFKTHGITIPFPQRDVNVTKMAGFLAQDALPKSTGGSNNN